MQYTAILAVVKIDIFLIKIVIYVKIFAKSIDCRHALESSIFQRETRFCELRTIGGLLYINHCVRGFEMHTCTIPEVVRGFRATWYCEGANK